MRILGTLEKGQTFGEMSVLHLGIARQVNNPNWNAFIKLRNSSPSLLGTRNVFFFTSLHCSVHLLLLEMV